MRLGLLSRPLGLALAAALAAPPAAAFDCDKAATPSEKAICADPKARAADDAMADAFAELLAAQDPAAKPTLQAAQARWLKERDYACADQAGAKLSVCLAQQSARRRAFLSGEPEAGPGAPGKLAPVFRLENGARGKAAIELQLLKYPSPATPAERAFNAAVDRLVGPLDEPKPGDPNPDRYEYSRSLRLTYASPRFVSAHLDGFSNMGGAHPITFSGNANIDVARGRDAEFADLVDARGAKAVFALCNKQVVAAKKARMGAEAPSKPDDLKELAKNVAEETGKLEAWSFGAGKATVTYNPYAVGAYVEGAYQCVIPYAQLKPLAKSGFPLP